MGNANTIAKIKRDKKRKAHRANKLAAEYLKVRQKRRTEKKTKQLVQRSSIFKLAKRREDEKHVQNGSQQRRKDGEGQRDQDREHQ